MWRRCSVTKFNFWVFLDRNLSFSCEGCQKFLCKDLNPCKNIYWSGSGNNVRILVNNNKCEVKFYDGRHQPLKWAFDWYVEIPTLILVRLSLLGMPSLFFELLKTVVVDTLGIKLGDLTLLLNSPICLWIPPLIPANHVTIHPDDTSL